MDILTYGLLNKKVEEAKNVSGEKITEAVNTYLDENPPTTGATAEQAAQIDKNVADIDELKQDLTNIDENLCEPFKDYFECTGSENFNGEFINKYTRKPESYPNYNYTVCNCKKGDIFYLHFQNPDDGNSVLCILVTDESGDAWLQEKYSGVKVDYSTEWLKYEITSENASKIYVSSFLTKAVIYKKEIDKSLVENVVDLIGEVDTLNSKIEITLNSAIKNRLGYIDGGACIFSCDDGFETDETYIFPLINNYEIPFVFGMWVNSPILSTKLDEIKNLITTKGCEIAQHYVEDCTGRSVLQNYNLFLEQKNMFKNIGIEIYNMIYPYNAYDENFEKTCSGLYDYACGGGYKNNTSKTRVYELNRIWINSDTDYQSAIDNAIKQNGLVIFGIHSPELADTNVMNVMQSAISYAKNSGIHITTLKGLNNL